MQGVRSFDNVRKIEVDDVIASDDIWVYLLHKFLPSSKQLFFFIKAVNFAAYDRRAFLKCKHISYEDFALSVNFYDICNLDNWVHIWLGKPTFFGGALDIKTHDAQWS